MSLSILVSSVCIYLKKKGKNTTEMQKKKKKICAVYGEDAMMKTEVREVR